MRAYFFGTNDLFNIVIVFGIIFIEVNVLIDREEIIKLLASYWPEADNETLDKMAEDVIIDVIPALYSAVRKAINNEKSEFFLEKYN